LSIEREKMIGGQLYDAQDPELIQARSRARNLCLQLNATREEDMESRRRLLNQIFGKGGDSVSLQPPFFCDYGSNIELGERVFFNFNCTVLDVCKIVIGSYSQFGSGVQILTPLHPLDAALRRKEEYGAPVTIGSDVWVGSGAIILPGVTIGSGAVVGAGSVVSRSLPERVLAVGNPCRIIREIE
jgi:maltose O-acetyltransferase